jgi:hypothetical protein
LATKGRSLRFEDLNYHLPPPGHGRSIALQLQTGNVDMKDFVLKEKPEPASNDVLKIKKGLKLSLAPVQELRLIASLLSSRQFGILATAGFDLGTMENLFN